MIGSGKDGNIYVVDTNNMGKFNPTLNNIYQVLPGAVVGGEFGSPVAFNGQVYFGGVGATLCAFQFVNGKLQATPASQSSNTFGYPGTTPSISSDGNANGIVWAIDDGNSTAVLYAYDATNLSTMLYNSNQAPNGRDSVGPSNKFITPTIANGKVYVATADGVAVFGLVKPAPTLSSIAVTSANPSVAKGLTRQFTATGTYSDKSTQDLTSKVTWASATTSVATITSGGPGHGRGHRYLEDQRHAQRHHRLDRLDGHCRRPAVHRRHPGQSERAQGGDRAAQGDRHLLRQVDLGPDHQGDLGLGHHLGRHDLQYLGFARLGHRRGDRQVHHQRHPQGRHRLDGPDGQPRRLALDRGDPGQPQPPQGEDRAVQGDRHLLRQVDLGPDHQVTWASATTSVATISNTRVEAWPPPWRRNVHDHRATLNGVTGSTVLTVTDPGAAALPYHRRRPGRSRRGDHDDPPGCYRFAHRGVQPHPCRSLR